MCHPPAEVPAAQGGLCSLPGNGPSPESDGERKTDSSQAMCLSFVFSCLLLNFCAEYDLHIGFIALSLETVFSFRAEGKEKS